MARRFLSATTLVAVVCACVPLWAAQSYPIPETTTARHGLARPWFAQVELDQARGKIGSVLLYEGVLYVQTDTATINAIDAETGKTLWSKQIGLANQPSMPPDAKGDKLAVVNGSRLFVVNRFNGDLLYEKQIKDAPGNGPALSAQRVYVPSVMGLIVGYQVESADKAKKEDTSDKTKTPPTVASKPQSEAARQQNVRINQKYAAPMFCQSFGRTVVQPLVTRDDLGGEYVVWPTDRGYLNFGRLNRAGNNTLAIKYRLETGATIVSRPAYVPPDPRSLGDAGVVFAASCDGFLYAVQEETGETLWRFSTGEPIVEPPAALDGRVYITTQLGGMYCLDAKTGRSLWWAENVMRFAAASKARVYATDATGRLLVLNAVSGARLDAIPMEHVSSILPNSDTDRIYLISDGGLIQCLREVEQTQPFVHDKDRKDAAKAALTAEPKKEEPKREHAAPRAPTTPKEKPTPKPKKDKEPKAPRRGSKAAAKGAGGLDANPDDPLGTKGKGAKTPRNRRLKDPNAQF